MSELEGASFTDDAAFGDVLVGGNSFLLGEATFVGDCFGAGAAVFFDCLCGLPFATFCPWEVDAFGEVVPDRVGVVTDTAGDVTDLGFAGELAPLGVDPPLEVDPAGTVGAFRLLGVR